MIVMILIKLHEKNYLKLQKQNLHKYLITKLFLKILLPTFVYIITL